MSNIYLICIFVFNTTAKAYEILNLRPNTADKACGVHFLNLRLNTSIKVHSTCFLNLATFCC